MAAAETPRQAETQEPPARWRFLLVFLLIQAVLFTVELLQPVRDIVINPFTEALAAVSGQLIAVFDTAVRAEGIFIESLRNGFILRIEAGCNGVEPMIILAAAVLAFPARWSQRFIGLVAGFVGIQAINILRIVSLFYIGQWNMQAFEWAHLYIWQSLILIDALVIWLLWVRFLHRDVRTA